MSRLVICGDDGFFANSTPDAATFLIAKIFDPHPGYPIIMEQTFHG